MSRSKAVFVLAARRATITRLPWRVADVLLALYPLPQVMWLWPYALADVADTEIGPS